MELRGESAAAARSSRRRPSASQRRARRGDQLHRHVARLRHQRGAHRPVHRRRDSEYFLATKCGCLVGASPAPRRARRATSSPAENILAGVEQSLRAMGPITRPSSFTARRRAGRSRRTASADRCSDLQARGQGSLHRHVRHPAQPSRSHRHGRLRRLQDPLLRRRSGAPVDHRGRGQGGGRIVIRGGAAKGTAHQGKQGGLRMGALAATSHSATCWAA